MNDATPAKSPAIPLYAWIAVVFLLCTSLLVNVALALLFAAALEAKEDAEKQAVEVVESDRQFFKDNYYLTPRT